MGSTAQLAVMMRLASRIWWTRPWTVVVIQPELIVNWI
jgi:hypothetical protein